MKAEDVLATDTFIDIQPENREHLKNWIFTTAPKIQKMIVDEICSK